MSNTFFSYIFYNFVRFPGAGCRGIAVLAFMPYVLIDSLTEVKQSSAVVSGRIESDGGSPVTECGILWQIWSSQFSEKIVIQPGTEIKATLTGLNPGTTYRCAIYATNAVGRTESTQLFTTQDKDVDIPDPYFLKFLLAEFDRKGGNKDGKRQASELSQETSLTISDERIKSLEGIQYFGSLTHLSCHTGITELNPKGMPCLMHVSCAGKQLNKINTEGCDLLLSVYCWGCDISSQDFCSNAGLAKLECSRNPKLYAISTKGCNRLSIVDCSDCDISSLDFSGHPNLSELNADNNPNLTSLKLDDCPMLKMVYARECDLKSLRIATSPIIEEIKCPMNPDLSSLKISRCPELEQLDCQNCNLSALTITDCRFLQRLECSRNQALEFLAIGNCPMMETLSINYFNLSGLLDVSKHPALKALYCVDNKRPESMNVSGYPDLCSIMADGASIGEVFVSAGQKENIPRGWAFPAGAVYTVR